MTSNVLATPAADPSDAYAHFSRKLAFEADCWDVHDALSRGIADFVLLDVRSPDSYAAGHVPGAINLPRGKMIASKMSTWPDDTTFVVYCAGPHCNGADKAAIRLAEMGRRVKLMIGGAIGWLDEGFKHASGAEPGSVRSPQAA